MAPRRIVVLDHFFAQDIAALERASAGRFVWRVVPYWRLRNGANRIFPADVQHGLEAYARPELEPQRRSFREWLGREVARMYVEWPFDLFVLPSDAFYYARVLSDVCHELGVPVAVVQKETTITDATFDVHAPDVRAHAPFVSDYMTVCSARHKRFWVTAGADPDLIEVTGQPRFDVYASPPSDLSWRAVGLEPRDRSVVFLSYEVDAYLSGDAAATGWRDLRDATERALFAAVADGWRVVVKLHPLQPYDEEATQLVTVAPGYGRDVVLAPPGADTRLLLLLADAVVGFQSTALLEALSLPKPVAYAGWGQLHDEVASGLIDFGSLGHLIAAPSSPAELTSWLRAVPRRPDAAIVAERRRLAVEYLGPFDGEASARTLAALDRLAAEWAVQRSSSRLRRRLDRRVTPSALVSAGRFAALGAGLQALRFVARRLGADRPAAAADFRLEAARSRRLLAQRTLAERLRVS